MDTILICKKIVVRGRVQGVFYRASAKKSARYYGIKGYVKNQADGSVLIHAEGKKINMQQFINWCKEGPPHAWVESIEVNEAEVKNYKLFEVKY
ncbi:MAG: acylphosphatase [Marinilabiliales bacterium]|nr:MAG: acylphosphatase [Marinilabiliales bacterium]